MTFLMIWISDLFMLLSQAVVAVQAQVPVAPM